MNMENSFIQLTDLPDEILMNILKQISHVDVLYSLIGVNKRLNNIAHDRIFTSYLNLMISCSHGNIYPLPNPILDRFCFQILPEIHDNIQWLNLESSSMERILLSTNYPNLYRLDLYDLDIEKAKDFFTDNTSVIHKFKNQISLLAIHITKGENLITRKNMIEHIFIQIFIIFDKLQYLDFGSHSINFQRFFFTILPPTLFSSTLLELRVSLKRFIDCLYLLDGRFNQLHTLKVNIAFIEQNSKINNKEKLPNLRYFSLHCKNDTNYYDEEIKPLVQRMMNLETLNLIFFCKRNKFIDGDELKTNIINYMPRLNKFTFNIFSSSRNFNQIDLRSNEDIHQTFKYFKDYQIISYVDYFERRNESQCRIYSYPYRLNYYKKITNNFPGGLFKYVSYISLFDEHPFEHEFFLQIAQSFPFLKKLSLVNEKGQNNKQCIKSSNHHQNLPIIKYPCLIELDFVQVHEDYIEQFLLDTKTYLPYNVTVLSDYQSMKNVTHNFRRMATQFNCSKVRYIPTSYVTQLPKHFKNYFLSIYIHKFSLFQ
ncbi:unnamed protein product [Rotaria sp. Silwood1]|nr:unnamed protein product [Rotaria sp. Silwood1]CAF4951966.1 unnamed protein product [Rotaria sp. Silwood1]